MPETSKIDSGFEKLSSIPSDPYSSPIRILVADDEKPIRDVLTDILQEEGFQIEVASDGDEALKILEDHSSDILITDLEMPRMRGIELLKRSRSLPAPPITILMTGFGTVETAIEAMKLGAYDYILKPFQVDEFVELIKRAVKKLQIERENVQLKELLSLYRISEAMMSVLDLDQVLNLIAEIVLSELGADRVAIYFREEDPGLDLRIEKLKFPGEEEPEPLPINFNNLIYLLENREHFIASGANLNQIINQTAPTDPSLPSPAQKICSLIASPLRLKREIKGFLIAVSYDPRLHFSEGHGKALVIFSSRAILALENARLYEELAQTFTQTIKSLVAALEAKDDYTRGHSERVAKYARMIAEAMGMSSKQVEEITYAALLHDIGKIGIHVEYLNKPEKLTEEEKKMFQLHPLLSKKIIEPINFLQGTVPAIYHHHEHFDGSGYPEGRKGEEIPLGARIMAVADSYEVMVSDRPYRKAMTRKQAISELKKCSGTQFDPKIVNVFLKALDRRGKGKSQPRP